MSTRAPPRAAAVSRAEIHILPVISDFLPPLFHHRMALLIDFAIAGWIGFKIAQAGHFNAKPEPDAPVSKKKTNGGPCPSA